MPTVIEPFQDEPAKQQRYKQYISYLRRGASSPILAFPSSGLAFPQPVDMTEWEWEAELRSFQSTLTPDLRALLPEVRSRQLPLAGANIAAPIAHVLKSKFTSSSMLKDDDDQPSQAHPCRFIANDEHYACSPARRTRIACRR